MIRILLISVVFLLTYPPSCFATESKALKALERIEFTCQSGADYSDYVSQVKQAEFEISRLDTSDKERFSRVLNHYRYAIRLWDWRTSLRNRDPATFAGQTFFQDYPKAERRISQGGVIYDDNPNFMSINEAIFFVWREASRALNPLREGH